MTNNDANKTRDPHSGFTLPIRALYQNDANKTRDPHGGFTLPIRALYQAGAKHMGRTIGWIMVATTVANLLSLFFPLTLLQMYDRVIPHQAVASMIVLATVVTVAILFEMLLRLCYSMLTQWLDTKFEYAYDMRIMSVIAKTPIEAFRDKGLGCYLEHFDQLKKLRNYYASQALTAFIHVPFVLVFLAIIAYIAGYVVVAPITVIACLSIVLVKLSSSAKDSVEKKMGCDSRLTNFVVNLLDNIHSVKAQALEAQLLRRYEKLYDHKHAATLDAWKTHALQLSKQLGSQCMIILVGLIGAPLVIHQQLTIGGLAATIILSTRCVQPLNSAAQAWIRLQTVKEIQDRLNKELDALPQEQEKHLKKIDQPPHITLNKVGLNKKDTQLLHDVSLDIPPQSCLGIVGSSESGTSTLLRILANEINATEGTYSINQIRIEEISPSSFYTHISYIPKEVTLYQDTILENLTSYQTNKVKEAHRIAEQLGLLAYIEHLPAGFNTILTPQMMTQIPRGIQQLIHVARGLIRESTVILFDEANAYLSLQTDIRLTKVLASLKGSKTLVIASQRPSLIKLTDQQFELENQRLESADHA